MARWDVGHFLSTIGGIGSTSVVSTHGLGTQPKAIIGLAGSSAADTFGPLSARFSLLGSTGSTATGAGGSFGFSSGVAFSTNEPFLFLSTGGVRFDGFTTASFNSTISAAPLASTQYPVGWAVVGGDDVDAAATSAQVSTVAASTQGVTGFGFAPNAALIMSASSFATSNKTFSVGFACRDTAGSIQQWSLSQTARDTAAWEVHRAASTESAVRLHSSASTRSVSRVTSFGADGIELTNDVVDTAAPVSIGVLGLSVPKAKAGKETITTNGAGAGQTGITVSGLGSLVGLVLLGSIGTSLQTVQADAGLSFGFATSDGKQRGAALFAKKGSTKDDAPTYFSSTRALTFLDTAGVVSQGLFAATSDGFTVTLNNTNANGWDVYWGALANTVTDIEAHILSSGALSANVREVDRISAAILSSGELSASLEKEFETGRGKLAAKSEIKTLVQLDGEDDDRFYTVQENTTAPEIAEVWAVTTTPQRIGIAEFGNARHLSILPPSTNTHPLRLGGSRSAPGLQISSRGLVGIPLQEDAGTDIYIFTTASTTIEGVRTYLR